MIEGTLRPSAPLLSRWLLFGWLRERAPRIQLGNREAGESFVLVRNRHELLVRNHVAQLREAVWRALLDELHRFFGTLSAVREHDCGGRFPSQRLVTAE